MHLFVVFLKVGSCLFGPTFWKSIDLCLLHYFMITAAEDVVIERTEPDPATQEFPCPHQIVHYKCQTLIPVIALTWKLPSGDTLQFTGASSVGRVRNSSDDQFSATLTGKMEDDDPDTDLLFFTSTLLILEPINGSSLTCIATVNASFSPEITTNIVLSGMYNNYSCIGRDFSMCGVLCSTFIPTKAIANYIHNNRIWLKYTKLYIIIHNN